jgi:hypothetical protein
MANNLKLTHLLEMVAIHGGAIVSTASLSPIEIDKAKEYGNLYVNEDGLGFAWVSHDNLLSWVVNNNQTV